ncbi:MAG: tRNA 2-thiouridine(34) synthase MnmA [Halanaerobium sp.]|nr:tRNA 2-thiouridine(34) synthase MnmA [Halanaerobium sp.]
MARVLCAMSGGVDSSVTAALLQQDGHEVIGTTMQIWPPYEEPRDEGGCCSLSAVEDARRVAQKLDIPFYVMNFQEVFQEKVIDYFIDEYKHARTPNPCIMCNKEIKFRSLLRKALELDCDYIATGHYARIEYNVDGRHLLYKAVDRSKDQAYALYNLTQEQLGHTLFPLGGLEKTETREIAKEMGFLVHDKPDSQEICFVTDDDYPRFLKEHSPDTVQPGPILDTEGKKLGEHEGLAFYTIGQRKGLGIAVGRPVYVVELDPERNAVIVGDDEEVFDKGLVASLTNWIAIPQLDGEMEVSAQIRYNAEEAEAVIFPYEESRVAVRFKEPQRAVTPGQAVVFYQGELVIGGAIIDESRNDL